MFRIFAIAVFLPLSLAALPGNSQQAPSSPSEASAPAASFTSAQELASKGHLESALTQLDQLATQNPEPAGVERLRGMIFYQREEFPKAIEAFAKAAGQDPGDHDSIEMHGVSLFRLGRIQEAIPFLEKARVGVQGANVDPNYVLALCYADVQRYDDARHAFAAQYGFAPDSAEAYLLAGRLFLRRELRDEAGAEATKALGLNASLPLAHELLGEVALARADTAGAIREFETERTINPLNPDLYDRLGDAYLRNGQYEDAQLALNRAVLLEPQATGPYILLGETFLKLKQPIQALHYLDHAEKMDPSNYITHNLLGQAYKATGQLDAANREFKMVVEIQHRSDPKPAGK
ncbi:tetratricopeptide repeat protein [Telmatobacter sp. DSM 110680]|uniref:Tetratricopeptide repeat protein n=1 Tax=Telmatobacter sp. DSM 110680 TaxID=3036704 RepID=A0AAU7DNP0_9BACT